ncbi:SH3 domain-containing protein [Sediminicola luteus]|uniref:SH3 domain-containing protein n=1 Tax=Sediminicola luteus TaxID=319238 RepID=UPI001C0F23A3|nr:SH3 domain-containing protein [Sediminicola luteus]
MRYQFKTGDTAYLFGNNVKLRTQPNTDSNLVGLLEIGQKVEILELTNETMEFEGINRPWYKVKSGEEVGYVLGGLLSLTKKYEGKYEYVMVFRKDADQLQLMVRLVNVKSPADYSEIILPLTTPEFYVNLSENKGLESVDGILQIDYMAEACGVDGGGEFLFAYENRLVHAISYSSIGDGGIYSLDEAYSFPIDHGEESDLIMYTYEEQTTEDDELLWEETKSIKRMLRWEGKKLNPRGIQEKE